MTDLGPLAAALAKAQEGFGVVKRDKTVTVKTRDGGSYSFAYAPLDTILGHVRQPLADNGLVLVQQLNDGALDTSLIHESGAILSGSIDLPATSDIQALGSAITYLRRYAIQALLGIAAEDDDDGNHAAGNIASPAPRSSGRTSAPVAAPSGNRGVTPWAGDVTRGQAPVDGRLRQTPEGSAFGFANTDDNGKRVQVLALGAMADAAALACADGLPKHAIVDGDLVMVPWDKDGKAMPPYRRVIASKIKTPEWELPAANMPAATPDESGKVADLDQLPF
jgi:hypothetical protein